MVYEPTPDLEQALDGLKDAEVPDDLADEVIDAVRTQKRYLGLHPREWAVIGLSLTLFLIAIQLLLTWGFGRFIEE